MAKCKFCNHIDRTYIETKLLTSSISNAEAGRIVGCSDTSIKRHMENHVTKVLEQVQRQAVIEPITGVLNAYTLLENAITFCDNLSIQALESEDFSIALMAMTEMRRTIETMAKLFEIHKKQEDQFATNKVELIITVIND